MTFDLIIKLEKIKLHKWRVILIATPTSHFTPRPHSHIQIIWYNIFCLCALMHKI